MNREHLKRSVVSVALASAMAGFVAAPPVSAQSVPATGASGVADRALNAAAIADKSDDVILAASQAEQGTIRALGGDVVAPVAQETSELAKAGLRQVGETARDLDDNEG